MDPPAFNSASIGAVNVDCVLGQKLTDQEGGRDYQQYAGPISCIQRRIKNLRLSTIARGLILMPSCRSFELLTWHPPNHYTLTATTRNLRTTVHPTRPARTQSSCTLRQNQLNRLRFCFLYWRQHLHPRPHPQFANTSPGATFIAPHGGVPLSPTLHLSLGVSRLAPPLPSRRRRTVISMLAYV